MVYVRISRDKMGAGIGVQRQEAESRALAERLGWIVVAVHVDNDLSAYSGKPRPGYRALLDDIQAGRADAVIVWHTDRLHRSPIELEEWISVCEPRAVEVHTVKAGPIDLASPSGRMVARQLGAVARYESEHRSERVKSAMVDLAARGGFRGGRRPFGYEADGVTVRESEAEWIAAGTRAILSGRSLRSVVVEWNAAGLRTTIGGQRWNTKTVRAVLLRARNAALIERHGAIVGPASWLPIVDAEQWRGVRALLTDPGRRTNLTDSKVRWLGSGLYRCGICDAPMRVGTSGSGSARARSESAAYRCSAASSLGGPVHVSRSAQHLDQFVSDLVIGRLSMEDAVELFTPADTAIDVEKLQMEVASIEAQRTELADRLGRGAVTFAQFDVANDRLGERQKNLEAAMAQDVVQNPVAELVRQEDVGQAWADLDLSVQRAVVDTLLAVRVLRARRGRKPGGLYFDPDAVDVQWREHGVG